MNKFLALALLTLTSAAQASAADVACEWISLSGLYQVKPTEKFRDHLRKKKQDPARYDNVLAVFKPVRNVSGLFRTATVVEATAETGSSYTAGDKNYTEVQVGVFEVKVGRTFPLASLRQIGRSCELNWYDVTRDDWEGMDIGGLDEKGSLTITGDPGQEVFMVLEKIAELD